MNVIFGISTSNNFRINKIYAWNGGQNSSKYLLKFGHGEHFPNQVCTEARSEGLDYPLSFQWGIINSLPLLFNTCTKKYSHCTFSGYAPKWLTLYQIGLILYLFANYIFSWVAESCHSVCTKLHSSYTCWTFALSWVVNQWFTPWGGGSTRILVSTFIFSYVEHLSLSWHHWYRQTSVG